MAATTSAGGSETAAADATDAAPAPAAVAPVVVTPAAVATTSGLAQMTAAAIVEGGAGTSATASSASSGGRAKKRDDALSWDEYFLAVAFLSAKRSKDPSTQVGACIVDPDNRIVGIGYNGMPSGCSDDLLPWDREGATPLETKYPYVCHAEMNAVLNKNSASAKNCRLYVALFPCNECAKLLIQAGIREVIYYSDKYHDAVPFVASRRLLDLAGVTYRQFIPKHETITLRFADVL